MTTTATTPDIGRNASRATPAAAYTWHVTAGDTGGAFCLAEAVVPAGCEPPLHIHAREEESFYVLDGKVTFQRGMGRIDAEPGDCVLLPRGIQHGFALHHQPRACSYWPPRARSRTLARPRPRSTRRTTPRRRPSPGRQPRRAGRLIAAFSAQGVEFTGPPLPSFSPRRASPPGP